MSGSKRRKSGNQPLGCKRRRERNSDRLSVWFPPDIPHSEFERIKPLLRSHEQLLARIGQFDAADVSVKQKNTQIFLELGDLLAHGTMRDAKKVSCPGQT